ncbi:MAG: hypothetical protein O7I42_05350 [Alphaproteobacteria bacterium]|nr:hypothetical protein [Alphaproteobacteria bacterium]
MFKQIIVASFVVLGLTSQALAGSCPVLSKQVTAGLAKMSMPAAKKTEITKLQNKGDMEHRTGKHAQSAATLKKALAMMGM